MRSSLLLTLSLAIGILVWLPSARAAAEGGRALELAAPVGLAEGGAPVSVRFRWSGPIKGHEAFFVVYPALSSRSQLAETLKSGPGGAPLLITRPHSLASLGAGGSEFVLSDAMFASLDCGAACDGVYPVELRIADDDSGVTTSQLLFALPYLSSTTSVSPRFAFAPILRVVPDSQGAALARALRGLSAFAAPYSVAFAGSPVTSTSSLRSMAGMVAGSSLHQRLLTPYVPLSTGCSLASPLLGFRERLAIGRDVGDVPQSDVLLSEQPSPTELAALQRADTKVVVLSSRVLRRVAPVLSLSDPVHVGGTGLELLGASPSLGEELGASGSPADMQRLIADLAQFYFQAPSQPGRLAVASVTVGSPSGVASVEQSLGLLSRLPFLRLETVQQAALRPALLIPSSGLSLARSSTRCSTIRGTLRTGLDRLAGLVSADAGSTTPLRSLVGLAEVAASTRSRTSAMALAQDTSRLASALDLVGSRTITLTAHSASIPLTLASHLPFPARVRLAVVAPEFRFPRGGSRLVRLDRGTVTVQVPVRVAVLGTFPATVKVLSPSGSVLRAVRVTVHSTGFSSVGIALTVASILVLAVWWVRTIRARRRRAEPT